MQKRKLSIYLTGIKKNWGRSTIYNAINIMKNWNRVRRQKRWFISNDYLQEYRKSLIFSLILWGRCTQKHPLVGEIFIISVVFCLLRMFLAFLETIYVLITLLYYFFFKTVLDIRLQSGGSIKKRTPNPKKTNTDQGNSFAVEESINLSPCPQSFNSLKDLNILKIQSFCANHMVPVSLRFLYIVYII